MIRGLHERNSVQRIAIALAMLFMTLSGVQEVTAQDAGSRPNILLIVSDDMGWGQVGFNGGTEIGTPNLDRIANEGVILTQFYATPSCSSTRASLLTGRHYWKTGGVEQLPTASTTVGMLEDERTIAEALHDVGYSTWALGKWHLGNWYPEHLPLQRGFDHHFGFYGGSIGYNLHFYDGAIDWHRNGRPVVERKYSTFAMAEEAVQLIGRHDGRNPFFLYLAFNAPHRPKQAPVEYKALYAHTEDPTQPAQIKAMDDAIGWVLNALDRKRILDDTLVVFLNDNGGPTRAGGNAPYRGYKGEFYEGGIRVAAAMRWPGRIAARSDSNSLLHVVDLFPTLVGLAGASSTIGLPLDGLNAWQTIADGAESPRQELAHSPRVMRVGDWKLFETNGVPFGSHKRSVLQLYNITDDPYETTNLAGSEPEKVAELSARLAVYRAEAREPSPRSPIPNGTLVYGRDENAAYGATVERTLNELEAGNPAPALRRIEAVGDVVTLHYSEELDPASVPSPSSFIAVTVPAYETVDVTEVKVNGTEVRLTMTQLLIPGETLGLTYEVPNEGRTIRDLDNLEAVGVTWVTTEISPIDPIWSSTVTVAVENEFRGFSSLPSPDVGELAHHTFGYGTGPVYQVQIVGAYSRGVVFQVRSRSEAISDLVLEWAGETLPLEEAEWVANWDRYLWDQAWLDVNAPSLKESAYETTLPEGSITTVCLRYAVATCSPTYVFIPKSDDAKLSSLTLSGIDFGSFAAGTTRYTTMVGNDVTSTHVTAVANDGNASVTITDEDGTTAGTLREVALVEGSNTITILVTAENGTTATTYTVTVTRETAGTPNTESDDATLSSLTLSSIDIGTFAAGTTSYSASVQNEVSSTQVTAVATEAKASVKIADGERRTAHGSREIALAEGLNTITILVTAEDGQATVTYTVTVTRDAEATPPSNDATLSILKLVGVNIGRFSSDTTTYAATVRNNVSSTQVTAVATNTKARVKIAEGASRTAHSSREITLAEGSNNITILVIAEDSTTRTTYTVTVTREAKTTQRSLTATFSSEPSEHDGTNQINLQIRFSASLAEGETDRAIEHGLSVAGGTKLRVTRVEGQEDLFTVTLQPDGNDPVTVTLDPMPDDCAQADAVCTSDGRVLSNMPSRTMNGPLASSGTASGSIVTLKWDSPRDDFGSPSVSDYGVRVNGYAHGVESVDLSGSILRIRLASPVSHGDTVTVAYLGSAMHPLAEATGKVRSGPWDGFLVQNLTGSEPPTAQVTNADSKPVDSLELVADDSVALDFSEGGLSEIWGVARLTSLKRLDLSGNSISDLAPLAGLVNLRELDLARNQIADLWPLSGLYNLERLNLTDNNVTDAQALAWLPDLKILLLDQNDVTDVWPLAAVGKLENLGLRGNRINDATALQDLLNLRRLDLIDNPVVDISPLGDIGSLVWLALPSGHAGTSTQTLWRLPRLGWVWFGDVGTAQRKYLTRQ